MNIEKFSLLWPENVDREEYIDKQKLSQRCVNNLGLDMIAREIAYDEKHFFTVKRIFLNLCDNQQVIDYRLQVMDDFMENQQLIEGFTEIFELIDQINQYKQPEQKIAGDNYRTVAWRLKMLDLYADCMSRLYDLFSQVEDNLTSEGLKILNNYIKEIVESDKFKALQQELPDMKEKIDELCAVTIGINLNAQLQPEEAIFLSVEKKPFKKRSLLSRLFGLKSNEDKFKGVSQYQKIISADKEISILQQGIFRELNDVFQQVLQPIEKTISRFVNYRVKILLQWRKDLSFYIGGSRFIKKMQNKGLAMCRPEVLARNDREASLEDLTDLTLALGLLEEAEREQTEMNLADKIVTNDIQFDDQARIYILTGPNQGGKTTFTRAVGIAQVLFQAGIFVPCSQAKISPVDWLHTHFTEEEKPQIEDGRLGEESRRLAKIFYKATPYSLLLLNESLSSTSPGEGLYLLKNIMKGIRLLRSRAIFTTHLHELANEIDSINQAVDTDSKVGSLVAEVKRNAKNSEFEAIRTFKIKKKEPQGKSFARDIAHKHGISFKQIKQAIKNREIIDG